VPQEKKNIQIPTSLLFTIIGSLIVCLCIFVYDDIEDGMSRIIAVEEEVDTVQQDMIQVSSDIKRNQEIIKTMLDRDSSQTVILKRIQAAIEGSR